MPTRSRRRRRGPSPKEAVIIAMLDRAGELCGIEFVKQSAGQIKLGTVYTTLDRMVDKGYVTSRQVVDRGQARRIYRLTSRDSAGAG